MTAELGLFEEAVALNVADVQARSLGELLGGCNDALDELAADDPDNAGTRWSEHIETSMGKDWLLTQIVALVNDERGEVPITIMLAGVVLHGTLVANTVYEHGLRNAGLVSAAYDLLNVEVGEAYSPDDPDQINDATNFLHLRDVEVVGHGLHLRWWRGDLEAVSGFSLG